MEENNPVEEEEKRGANDNAIVSKNRPKRWSKKEDRMLIDSCISGKEFSNDLGRTPGNIYIRKLVLARNMVERENKSMEEVSRIMNVASEELAKKISNNINSNLRKVSNTVTKKSRKNMQKISDESHLNLLIDYKEIKEKLNKIDEKLELIYKTIQNN